MWLLSCLLVLAALAALLSARPAHAVPLPGSSLPVPTSPADRAEIQAGGPVPTFAFKRGPGGSNYGGQYTGRHDSYRIHVSRDPTILANGTIQNEVELAFPTPQTPEGPWSWTPFRYSYTQNWFDTPGVYYWQVVRFDCYQDTDCYVEGPIFKLTVTSAPPPPSPAPAPIQDPYDDEEWEDDWEEDEEDLEPRPEPPLPSYADLTGEPISLKFGGRRKAVKFWVNPDTAPGGVSRQRFLALAIDSGTRWGARYMGTSRRRGYRDGQNTVVFRRSLPRQALGVTRWYNRSRLPTGERDIAITTRVRWHDGPGRPPRTRYDLQTVLIHEFGHFVGNDHVSGRCRNNPMIVAAGPGEWWRSPTDWGRCGHRARTATVAAAKTGDRSGAPGGLRPM